MAEQSLIIYTSPGLLSNDQIQNIDHNQQALILGKRTHHYHSIPLASKGIEPYLALSSIPIVTAAYSPPHASNPSHHFIQIGTTEVRPGPSSIEPSSDSADNVEPPSSSTASASGEQPRSRRIVPRPEFKEDAIPLGKAADIIAWTDDDVDATDYKNMPGYDPDQEESEYDSTPPPETEIVPSQTLDRRSPDASSVKRYVRIYNSASVSTMEEVSAKYLLLLFIPGPLNPLTFPSPPGDTPTTPGSHEIFLSHLARYPYLTSHDNYLRHTGYVLSPSISGDDADGDAPEQRYLIVQEFSELERRAGRAVGVDWERKRKEAKHWWRKEERGARGVKAGFFKRADAEKE